MAAVGTTQARVFMPALLRVTYMGNSVVGADLPARPVGKNGQRRAAVLTVGLAVAAVFVVIFAGWGGPSANAAAPPTYGRDVPPYPPSVRFPAYYIEWGVYARDYVVADIPAPLLTHINYAFIKPEDL